jgi:hypothetical protein
MNRATEPDAEDDVIATERWVNSEVVEGYTYLCRVAADLCRARVVGARHRFGLMYFRLLFSFADAIRQLTPECNDEDSPRQPGMTFAAMAPLIRALIEAYAWFWFYAVEDVGADEQEFRLLLANRDRFSDIHSVDRAMLSGLNRIAHPSSETKRVIELGAEQRDKVKQNLQSCHDDLRRSTYYRNQLCDRCKQYIGSPNAELKSWVILLDRAGLDRKRMGAMHDYLSKWVHGLPFAAAETSSREVADHSAHLTLLPVCCGILKLALDGFMRIVPGSRRALGSNAHDFIRECSRYLQFVKPQCLCANSVSHNTAVKCSMCDLR